MVNLAMRRCTKNASLATCLLKITTTSSLTMHPRLSRSLQPIGKDLVIRLRRGSSDGGDYGDAREGCEEICCAAELGRARAVGSFDSEGKKSGATAAEGADFVEGGCFGSWRWVERQQDHGGPGDQRLDGLPGP